MGETYSDEVTMAKYTSGSTKMVPGKNIGLKRTNLMSKQADEELLNDISNLLEDYADQTGTRYIIKPQIMPLANQVDLFIQTNYTPNHLVEQRCLEARIDEAKDVRKNIESLGTEVYFALQRIDGHIKELEAQLTNLQNKEEEK